MKSYPGPSAYRTCQQVLAVLVCANLVACTSLRTVTDWQPPTPPASTGALKPGDRITVTTTDNRKSELVFVTLTADALEGTAGKDKTLVQIPRNQVQNVERRETSVAKTVTLVGSIVLLTLLTVGLSNAAFVPPGTY